MVCVDINFLPQKNIFKFFERFNNGSNFFFCCCVVRLHWVQFLAIKRDWFSVLADDSAELEVAGVRMDVKRLVKIWVRQKRFVRYNFLIALNAFWCFSSHFQGTLSDVNAVSGANSADWCFHMSL